MALNNEIREEVVSTVRRFVEREVLPVASELEHRDEYPHALVDRMKELGLFGATIPQEYGGLGLDVTTYAMVVEELCRGWMSLSGVLNTHLLLAYMLRMHGTEDQKQRYLPPMARGEHRGALCLTEPHAGSDVQRIRTTAVRQGDVYILNGSKMFITNARYGTLYAIAAKTDKNADPPYRGISMFVGEKGPGLTVGRDLEKLGYKGVETCEVNFEDYAVPAANLIGGKEGQGFAQVMSGLEVGRVNIAARAVGVSKAAFEHAIKYAQQRRGVREADRRASGDPAQARRHGDQDRSGAAAHLSGGGEEGPGRALRSRSRHGEAVRVGDLPRGRRPRPCASSAATATSTSSRSSATTATRR